MGMPGIFSKATVTHYTTCIMSVQTPEDTKDIAKQAAKFPSVLKPISGVNSDKIFKIAQTVRTWA